MNINVCFGIPETKLIDFKFSQHETFDRIKLFFNQTPQYNVFTLEDPGRLVLDIKNCFFPSVHKIITTDSITVKRLRASQFNRHKIRFVVDHKKLLTYHLKITTHPDFNGAILIIDIVKFKEKIPSSTGELIDNPITSQTDKNKVQFQNASAVSPEADTSTVNINSFFKVPDGETNSTPDASAPIAPVTNISETSRFSIDGSIKNETAYRTNKSHHFSKIKTIFQANATGNLSSSVSYYVGSRTAYDAVFDLTDNYNENVENDQEFLFELREAYLDIGFGNFDFRLGNQQIVWGQALGLFLTDIVNPKDLREYILPEFDQMRIPVFAANIEYYRNDNYFQFIFIPFPKFNEFGEYGSEFDFSKLFNTQSADIIVRNPKKLSHSAENYEVGFRVSRLIEGWDLSGFLLYDFDNFPVNYRNINLNPPGSKNLVTITYRPEYERVPRFGMTFSKDYLDAIVKGELILSNNKKFLVSDITDLDGIKTSDSFDWLLGVDYTFFNKIDSNFQFMQGIIMNHEATMIVPHIKSSFSIWLKTGFFNNKIEPEIFFISSFNQKDFLIRPKIVFNYNDNLKLTLGVDIFEGEPDGDFGVFDENDRVYMEMLYYY